MNLYKLCYKLVVTNLNRSSIYEYYTHYLLEDAINSDCVAVDLGANRGEFYSLLNAKYNCMCYVIEASPDLFNELPTNKKTKSFNYAIGKENGLVTFFLSNNSEANSLTCDISNLWGNAGSVQVQGITFEKFIREEHITNIDILKIDIEGAELDVLENVTSHTLLTTKQITVEFHDFLDRSNEYKKRMKDIIKKLKQNGFLVIKTSDADWREVLCLNKKLVHVNYRQQIRLRIIIPTILICMSFYRNAATLKNLVFKKEISPCI